MPSLTLDRVKLHDALYRCTTTEKLYAWANTFNCLPRNLKSIGIKDRGELTFPIEVQQVNVLLEVFGRKEAAQHEEPFILNKSQLCDPQGSTIPFQAVLTEMAATAVREAFNVNSSAPLNVDAVLHKLVIISNNEAYHDEFNTEKEPGTFGCMLLQIPVKDVTGGASLLVHYGKESIFLQFDGYCQTKYYISVLAGKRKAAGRQDFTVMPANKSPCVLLVANLVWLDAVSSLPKVEPDRFPQYVESVQLANRALAGWRQLCHETKKKHLPSTPSQADIHEGPHWVNTTAVNPTGYYFPSNEPCKVPLVHGSLTRSLCFPLTRNYSLESYSISSLLDRDALIYRVLNSIDYINTELLLIETKSLIDWRKSALKKRKVRLSVSKRIPQEDSHLHVLDQVKLCANMNLVGNLKRKIICSHHGTDASEANKCLQCFPGESKSFYVAFLIHPKGVHVKNDKEKYIQFHLNDLLSRVSKLKEHDHIGSICQELCTVIDDLGNFEAFKSSVIHILMALLNAKGWEDWKTVIAKLATKTDFSRTFPTFFQLALELNKSHGAEEAKEITVVLTNVFFESSSSNDWKSVVPFFTEIVATVVEIIPKEKQNGMKALLQKVFERFPAVALATVLEHRNSTGCIKETFYKFLIGILVKKFLDAFKAAHPNPPLWASLKENNTACFYNHLLANENRNALFTYLANCCPAVAKETLNVIAGNVARNITMDLDSLTNAVMFFASVEANGPMSSDTRTKLFFSTIAQRQLETVCRLPSKLRSSIAVSLNNENCGAFKTWRALMETLVIDQLRNVVKLNDDVVNEVVDCLFLLKDKPLILRFIQHLILLGNGSFKCLKSSFLQDFVALLLGGAKIELEENVSNRFVSIWMTHLTQCPTSMISSSSLLAKTFNFCFPSNLSHRSVSLSKQFAELIAHVSLECLADFLMQVQQERMTDVNSIFLDGLSFLCVLDAACQKLVKDPHFLGTLSDLKWKKVLEVIQTVFKLGDEVMVADLARPILSNKGLSQSYPALYDDLMDCCSNLERILTLKAQEFHQVERDMRWAVAGAVVPGNKQLEMFLRSDHRRQVFGLFDTRDEALAFGNQLINTIPIPVGVVAKPVGMSYVCELVKEQAFATWAQSQFVLPLNYVTPPLIGPPMVNVNNLIETWCIEEAVVPNNRQLQAFLRSDAQSQLFPALPFFNFAKAQSFCDVLRRQSTWPIYVSVQQVGAGYYCAVTKALAKQVPIHPVYASYFVNPLLSAHGTSQPVVSGVQGNVSKKRPSCLSNENTKRAKTV